jgi:hypothetical protein
MTTRQSYLKSRNTAKFLKRTLGSISVGDPSYYLIKGIQESNDEDLQTLVSDSEVVESKAPMLYCSPAKRANDSQLYQTYTANVRSSAFKKPSRIPLIVMPLDNATLPLENALPIYNTLIVGPNAVSSTNESVPLQQGIFNLK